MAFGAVANALDRYHSCILLVVPSNGRGSGGGSDIEYASPPTRISQPHP